MNRVRDLITNVDVGDIPETYFSDARGFRNIRESILAERDYGTKDRLSAFYPSGTYSLRQGFTLKDVNTLTDYEIAAVIDAADRLRLYYLSGSAAAIELTRKITAAVTGISGTGNTVDIGTIQEWGTGISLGVNELAGWVCINTTTNVTVLIISSTATGFTFHSSAGASVGTGMAVGNNLEFYPFYTIYQIWNYVNGATPHIRWNPIESQRKVNLLYGSSASPAVINEPVRVQRTDSIGFFEDSGGNSLATLPAYNGFQITRGGGGLIPFFSHVTGSGSTEQALLDGDFVKSLDVYDDEDGSLSKNKFMTMYFQCFDVALTVGYDLALFWFTLVFDGYQESDPICYVAAQGTFGSNSPSLNWRVEIDIAKMPRNLTHIRVYVKDNNNGVYTVSPDDAKRCYTLPIKNDGSLTSADCWELYRPTVNEPFKAVFPELSAGTPTWISFSPAFGVAARTNTPTLSGALNRTVKTTARTYKKPRYGIRSARSENPLTVIDVDDRTLRMSNINGNGDVEDDNFPDVSVDLIGNSFAKPLLSSGEILGLANQNEVICAVKPSLIESYDFQSSLYRQIPVDCIAKRSILPTEFGLVFAGQKGLYLLTSTTSAPDIINPLWLNLYDGRLRTTDNANQRVTSANRQATIVGYSIQDKVLIAYIQMRNKAGTVEDVCALYSVLEKTWAFRKFNFVADSVIAGFSTKSDNSFTIIGSKVYHSYPNLVDADVLYEDGATTAGVTNNKYIEAFFELRLGSLTTLAQRFIPFNLLIEHTGTAKPATSPTFTVKLYANEDATEFQTLIYAVTSPATIRRIRPRGPIKSMRVRLELTGDVNTRKFDVSRIAIGYLDSTFKGTL